MAFLAHGSQTGHRFAGISLRRRGFSAGGRATTRAQQPFSTLFLGGYCSDWSTSGIEQRSESCRRMQCRVTNPGPPTLADLTTNRPQNRRGTISLMSSRPGPEPHLRDLARLRRVRDRIDREYALPLDVE